MDSTNFAFFSVGVFIGGMVMSFSMRRYYKRLYFEKMTRFISIAITMLKRKEEEDEYSDY